MSVVIAQILLSYAPSLISLRVCVQEPIPLTVIGVGMVCGATPRPQQLHRETLSQKTKNRENHGPRSQLKHKWPTTRTFFILQQENTSREAGKDPWLKNPLLKNHPHPRQSMVANLLWEFVDGEDKTTVFRICCKILHSEHFIRQMRNVGYQHSPVLITMTEVRSKRFLVCVRTTQLLSQIPVSHTLSALCVA